MEEQQSAPKIKEELKKSLFIIKSDKYGLINAENYLKNRDWELGSSDEIRQAMVYILNKKPTYVMVTVDHSNSKVDKLPGLLKQTFPVKVIVFAESHSSKSLHKLRSLNHPYTLMPPISGPMIERMIHKITREEEKKQDISLIDKKHNSFKNQNESDVISIKNSNNDESYQQIFSSNENNNSKIVINQDKKEQDNTYITQETKTSDGRGNYYFDSDSKDSSYYSSADKDTSEFGNFQQQGHKLKNSNYHSPKDKEDNNHLHDKKNKNSKDPNSPLSSQENSKQSNYKQQNAKDSYGSFNQLKKENKDKDEPSENINQSSNKKNPAKNDLERSPTDYDHNFDTENDKNAKGNLLNKNTPSNETNINSNKNQSNSTTGSQLQQSDIGNKWKALEQAKKQKNKLKKKKHSKESKATAPPAKKEKRNNDLSNPFTRSPNSTNSRSDKVKNAKNNKSKSHITADKKNDKHSKSSKSGLKKNKKGAGLYRSVLEEATQEALNTSTNLGNSTEVNTLDVNTNFSCISVSSQTYNGYLLAAGSSNQYLDDQFIKTIKSRVVKFLESKGEQIYGQNDLEIKVEKVNYPNWSEEEAEFFRRSIHQGEEIGMAFFENQAVKHPLYIRETEDMICLSIDDILEDQPIEFDLFIYLERNDRFLKITKKGGKLFSNQKDKLRSSGIKEMHIPKEQKEQLEKYKAQNFLNENIKNYLKKKNKG